MILNNITGIRTVVNSELGEEKGKIYFFPFANVRHKKIAWLTVLSLWFSDKALERGIRRF